jgi:hypothetical protein
MNLNKVFTSKQSVIAIILIAVISFVVFLFIQNKVVNIEQETIKREVELKQKTELLLFKLKETLRSGKDKTVITQESLNILSQIRSNLDQEYKFLRIQGQKGVDRLRDQLDEVEKAILEEDFEKAANIVEDIIEDLEDSDNLADYGDGDDNDSGDGNDSGGDNNYDPDYSDDNNNDNDNNDDSNDDNDNNNNDDNQENDNQGPNDDNGGGGSSGSYHSGYIPEVDRDYSTTENAPIKTKVGD